MAYAVNFADSLAIAQGIVPGVTHVNKFGRNTDCDDGILSDIWDLATQPIWLAPTAARIHAIVSSSASDDGDPGAATIRIYGLKTWDSAETSEDITMNGTTPVNTANSYVIIHRMQVLTSLASGPNVGIIKATAATDNTITAQINAGEGQTHMAIYGIPSTQIGYMTEYHFSILRAGGGASNVSADAGVLVTADIENQPTVFLHRSTVGVSMRGTSHFEQTFIPYNRFVGPCIIKLDVVSDTDNVDISAGFDLILVDN